VTLGKEPFAECQKKTLGKETLCWVSKIKHSAKSFFAECFILPRVFCVALGKEFICRVPEIKHSAKNMALGKEPNSGSVMDLRALPVMYPSPPTAARTMLGPR
jgi:hypothetical protein